MTDDNIETVDLKPTYVCAGCDRKTDDPVRDLAEIRARGFLACCPERKMVKQ